MEHRRFDALTRLFARPASRRRTLAGVVAAALAPLTTAAQPEPAKCLPVGKRCSQPPSDEARHGHGKQKRKGGTGKHHPPSCGKCCSRFGSAGPDGKARCSCKGEGIGCDNSSQCCSGQCRDNACTTCPPNAVFCPDGCANLETDKRHCGSCGNACASGQRCQDGTCVCDGQSCPTGCCDANGVCRRGTANDACGDGGAGCAVCDECDGCDGTVCAAKAHACCGDGAGVCRDGACYACRDGQRCVAGACVCDATSCPDGCCDGNGCVSVADQSDDVCGTGGEACHACAGTDTCGGGGTDGVCGCTPQCAGKNCGDANACGGTCDSPCANECQRCDGGVCRNKDNGAVCGDPEAGLRCCNGSCPPPQACLPAGSCCAPDTTCAQCCGALTRGTNACSETEGYSCRVSAPGEPCFDDRGCSAAKSAICRCGTCCVASGGDGRCPSIPDLCCSGACNGIVCA